MGGKSQIYAVAMSGGVDSSVVAAVIQKAGHGVFGITMDIHENCIQDLEDAEKVCKKLGIPHYIIDVRTEYKKKVIDLFSGYYSKGLTPNPCALCNRDLKLNLLVDFIRDKGADFMATGHYAKLRIDDERVILSEAANLKKDQSYFVSLAPKDKLKFVRFPLGDIQTKDETRKIAAEFQLPNSKKEDSQDICFIRKKDYREFLNSLIDNSNKKRGEIRFLKTGEVIGQHSGITNYTVGQRKGLGISHEKPLYVVKINPENNNLVVGEKKDLDTRSFSLFDTNWLVDPKSEIEVFVKLRSFGKKSKALVTQNEKSVVVKLLEQSLTPVTNGQVCAIYDENNVVLGAGIILKLD
ncbi:MAG: tRNA 2-thiouridine(34) synthase MnmA [Holosporales bacterium]|jgi:tRNA-specific 2-thiouridylase|nr:tRNA 2-thiouridine(34) synthase MnmA [Holosporales bacterium]